MIVETRFGTLDVPKAMCVMCIAKSEFMQCTMCEMMAGLQADAMKRFPNGLGNVKDMTVLYDCESKEEKK